MRIFINDVNGFVGKHFAKFALEQEMEDLELVGTIKPGQDKPKWAKELYKESDAKAIKAGILSSEVILFDLFQHTREATNALKVLVREKYEDNKCFICVSTMMSWAKTVIPAEEQEGDEEVMITEEMLKKRKPHANFKPYLTTENLILAKGASYRDELSTYVIWPGILYGGGELCFHSMFKRAWQCQTPSLICLGSGNNTVPTLHITDLCNIIMHFITERPAEPQAVVAVDNSHDTLAKITQAVANELGPGVVTNVTYDEYLETLTSELDRNNYSLMLQLDLKMEFVSKDSFGFEWHAPDGMVAFMRETVAEYRVNNRLTPVGVVVHGPPYSGKSFYAEKLAYEYDLPHLKTQDVINEYLALDDAFSEEIKASQAANAGRIADDVLVKIFQKKLNTYPCQNQGYVLDGFPKTYKQARGLFSVKKTEAELEEEEANAGEEAAAEEEEEGEEGVFKPKSGPVPPPKYCIQLEAPDAFLKENILKLTEEEIAGSHNSEEGFTRRLQLFKTYNEDPTQNVIGVLEDNNCKLLTLDMVGADVEECLELMRLTLGQPHNYNPHKAAEARAVLAAEEEKRQEAEKELQLKAEEERLNQEREVREAEDRKRFEEIQRQEKELLEARSQPLRKYLMDNVLPVLTKGLLDVSKVRPDDPIDFLAEYLFNQDSA